MDEPLSISNSTLLMGDKPLPFSLGADDPISAGVWKVSIRWSHGKKVEKEEVICSFIIYDDPNRISDGQLRKYFEISIEDDYARNT